MSEAPIQPINVTFHCNACGGKRNHALLIERVHEWNEELHYDEESGPCRIRRKEVYILLRCCGCDSVSLKHESFSEAEGHPTIKTYPPRQFRQMPAWVQEIENFVAWKGDANNFAFIPRLLKEIYGSLHSEHRGVSAMGIRALLELIMIEKIGDRGSLGKDVEAISERGIHLPPKRTLLDPTLEFGHASMHRNYAPKMKELITALDITESLIHTLYILPDKAKSLSDAVPKRNRND